MRPRRRLGAAILVLVCLAATACRVGQDPRPAVVDPDSAARADIRATMDAYRAALLENDPDALAPFFTADARLSEPGMEDVEGAAAIRGFMVSSLDAGIRVTNVGVDTDAVHVAGVNAFEFGSFVESFQDGHGVEQTVRGRYAIHWRRGPEARWRIRRFLLNHLPGDSPAPVTAEAAPPAS